MKSTWSCHFRFLTQKDYFLNYFIVILRFDTEIRRRYFAEPNFSLTFDQYQSRFMQFLIQHMRCILTSDKALSRPQRFAPYCSLTLIDTGTGVFLVQVCMFLHLPSSPSSRRP